MAKDKRVFLRMNSDDSPLAVPNGDALAMLNCRVFPTYVTTVPGNLLVPENAFVGKATYTATCGPDHAGQPVTRTATASSADSQEIADQLALNKAKLLAESGLVCIPTLTAWRGLEGTGDCVKSDNGNTGYYLYATLEEYFVASGEPTGNTKPNNPNEEHYLAPALNAEACPVSSLPNNLTVRNYAEQPVTIEFYKGAYSAASVYDSFTYTSPAIEAYTLLIPGGSPQTNIRITLDAAHTPVVNSPVVNGNLGFKVEGQDFHTFINVSVPIAIDIS